MIKIEKVIIKNETYAIIVKNRHQFKKRGVNFATTNKELLQLGFIKHKKKTKIRSHFHIKRPRTINYLSEVLFIKKGILKVKFYDKKNKDLKKDKILKKNDIILLLKGGHGFEVIQDLEMIEVKQGPYIKSQDKVLIK